MAQPQVENGSVLFATELMLAMCRSDFSVQQLRLMLVIGMMTYGVGKSKSEISIHDLRYAADMKKFRVEETLAQLIAANAIFRQELSNGDFLLGIQKDFDKWLLPQRGNALKGKSINNNTSALEDINNTNLKALPDSGKPDSNANTPAGRFLGYVLKEMALNLTIPAWRGEYAKAVQLYTEALELAQSPTEAMYALKDYFDYKADAAFRAKVNRPITLLAADFGRWYKQQPKKPKRIRLQEEATGRRWKYDFRRGWKPSEERIKPATPPNRPGATPANGGGSGADSGDKNKV